MAMDSHDDDHYELLIDSVNNNHNEKSEFDTSLDASKAGCSSERSSLSSSVAAQTVTGSSRRKCASLSKGITIEQFLESRNQIIQLTAIDKLIQKNKAALAEDQMKRANAKTNDEFPVISKNSEKKSRGKPFNSKVISSKLKHSASIGINGGKTKTNGVKNKNSAKLKVSVEITKDPSDKLKKLNGNKIEKLDEEKKKSIKKTSEGIVKVKDKETNGRKTIGRSITRSKKNSGVGGRDADGKLRKNRMTYRTRSINNERLRNGKARIIKSVDELPPDFAKRRGAKAKENGLPTKMLKRPIKLEPSDDEPRIKRRKMVSQGTARKRALTGNLSDDDTNVKNETIELPHPGIVEVNVETEEILLDCCDIKSEPISTTEEIPVPNGLVLQDFRSLRDYETNSSKSFVDNNEELICLNGNEEDNSDNINLHIDSEVILIDDDDDEDERDQKLGELSDATKLMSQSTPISIKSNQTEDETIFNRVIKKNDAARDDIFSALGLQSIGKPSISKKETKLQSKETSESKENNYRGTLKMVIKTDKGFRRMEMKNKAISVGDNANVSSENIMSFYSKIQTQNKLENGIIDSNTNCTNVNGAETSQDSSSMSSLLLEEDNETESLKKCGHQEPLVNSINEVAVTEVIGEPCSVLANGVDKTKAVESLVVPEKSSSFSIHPNRLCYDVCKYCFGKFGTLDTPCHVGQLRDHERQNKILECEPNLKIDTCLCDACFRVVTRKAIRPLKSKEIKSSSINRKKFICDVQECSQTAIKVYGKGKWRSKLSRKIVALSIDIGKKEYGSPLALCNRHFATLAGFCVCEICGKRLNNDDTFCIREQFNELNEILRSDGIPVTLRQNGFLCKFCRHYTYMRLVFRDYSNMSAKHREDYETFKKVALRCIGENPNETTNTTSDNCDTSLNVQKNDESIKLINGDHLVISPQSPPPKFQSTKSPNCTNVQAATVLNEKSANRPKVEFNKTPDANCQSLTPSDKDIENELPLKADFSFEERSNSSSNWERCVSTIQFDAGTKKLWQDLQKPYGNQSSFIRHLIMLEKYWRNGSLVLSDTADSGAIKYINSVKNRIESLETSSCMLKTPIQKQKNFESIPPALTLIPPPLQPAPKTTSIETNLRPPSAPPPLLKLNYLPSPFIVRKSTPVCAVKPSSEVSPRTTAKLDLPEPPKLERIYDRNTFPENKAIPLSLKELKNMIVPQYRYKSIPVSQPKSISITRKVPPPPLLNCNALRKPSVFEMLQLQSSKASQVEPSQPIPFPKLPKALTVIQMDKKSNTPSGVAAPFMVGEKPSVSVFRDLSK